MIMFLLQWRSIIQTKKISENLKSSLNYLALNLSLTLKVRKAIIQSNINDSNYHTVYLIAYIN